MKTASQRRSGSLGSWTDCQGWLGLCTHWGRESEVYISFRCYKWSCVELHATIYTFLVSFSTLCKRSVYITDLKAMNCTRAVLGCAVRIVQCCTWKRKYTESTRVMWAVCKQNMRYFPHVTSQLCTWPFRFLKSQTSTHTITLYTHTNANMILCTLYNMLRFYCHFGEFRCKSHAKWRRKVSACGLL